MALSDLPTLGEMNATPRAEPKGTKHEARMKVESARQEIRDKEDRHKSAARKRDGWVCRFPRCVCHRLRLAPEVHHVIPKGFGGDHGTVSTSEYLVCLCRPRHRESRVSFHFGAIQIEALTPAGMNGAIRWWIDITAIFRPLAQRQPGDEQWFLVAEEESVRVLKPLTRQQGDVLERIAELAA